ncbi:GNAT family N-acetyltransferase [Dysgonomonas sp. 511]|uniref:GNAT family N-acetyltransferase n=1 Tax=Dysgonomonas sp. 511 TaxID=2302930 RepID=UPI0013D8D568|nr:GNAT family N-acetyltransferase [Dysgonomonas sp. 511]NDV78707.1 GNAT family N-acetyltransferase [Dysgonomonas sp. 511]
MIQFATRNQTPEVRQMWKECFCDDECFLDLYFSEKYRPENTLLYFADGKAVAALQMLPYSITFYGHEIPFAYLAGLCTLPEYRRRGYMNQLIRYSHEVIASRNIPLSILIPAEESLFGFYEQYGYTQVFDGSEEPIPPLKELLSANPYLYDAYDAFDSIYRKKDFCVQKTFEDFRTIVKEQNIDGFPDKYNLAGMARIIDKEKLWDLYSKATNNQTLGKDEKDDFLCRLLFGYKTDELDEPYRSLFPVHHPVMNLMLE